MTLGTVRGVIGGVLCAVSAFCLVYTLGADKQFEADKKAITEFLDDLGYTAYWYDRQMTAIPKVKH